MVAVSAASPLARRKRSRPRDAKPRERLASTRRPCRPNVAPDREGEGEREREREREGEGEKEREGGEGEGGEGEGERERERGRERESELEGEGERKRERRRGRGGVYYVCNLRVPVLDKTQLRLHFDDLGS